MAGFFIGGPRYDGNELFAQKSRHEETRKGVPKIGLDSPAVGLFGYRFDMIPLPYTAGLR